jgi:hypothetical protein
MELAKLDKPTLPTKWDYDTSVKKTKGYIYRWKNLTENIAKELWIAREKLSNRYHRDGANAPSWNEYCVEIGSTKSTVNRWLAQWFDESMVSKLTGNAENYTKKEYIDKIRKVLGEIDLDPASCEYAQETVQAKKYFTKDDDGLSKKWGGRVFLNPPYGMPDIRNFTDKLISELPNIESAILLTNDQTDTDWWQGCAVNAQIICMPDGRLSFYTPNKDKTCPTNGQTFFYYGTEADKFKEEFKDLGLLVKVI